MVTTVSPSQSPFFDGGEQTQGSNARSRASRVPRHNETRETLRVAGLTPLSTTDFPGQLAAVVFVQGCAWRCRYCHNPEIQARLETPSMSWQAVLEFLDRRQGLLDGVVFCGGEPTVDRHLGAAIDDVRHRGLKVGLHTAGIYPDRLRRLLPKIDWVGFDVKAPFDNYTNTTGVPGSGERAKESLNHLLASGVAHEVRTTRHPALLSSAELQSMTVSLRQLGVKTFALQEFRPDGCTDRWLDSRPPPLAMDVVSNLEQLFPTFILRRAS